MWIHWCASMLNWYPNIITRFSVNTVRNNYRFAFPTFSSPEISTPVFSSPGVWCREFHSRDFHPCIMVPRFPLPRFPLPRIQRPVSRMTFKTSTVRIFAYVHPDTPANPPQEITDYWTKVHGIFNRGRGNNGGVNATTNVAILPSVVECQRTKWRSVSILADTRHKSVTIATSLDRAVAVWIYCYKAH